MLHSHPPSSGNRSEPLPSRTPSDPSSATRTSRVPRLAVGYHPEWGEGRISVLRSASRSSRRSPAGSVSTAAIPGAAPRGALSTRRTALCISAGRGSQLGSARGDAAHPAIAVARRSGASTDTLQTSRSTEHSRFSRFLISGGGEKPPPPLATPAHSSYRFHRQIFRTSSGSVVYDATAYDVGSVARVGKYFALAVTSGSTRRSKQ
jgi:hypothetical protein